MTINIYLRRVYMKEANVLTVEILDLIDKYREAHRDALIDGALEEMWLIEEIIDDLTKLKDRTLTNQ